MHTDNYFFDFLPVRDGWRNVSSGRWFGKFEMVYFDNDVVGILPGVYLIRHIEVVVMLVRCVHGEDVLHFAFRAMPEQFELSRQPVAPFASFVGEGYRHSHGFSAVGSPADVVSS